MDITTIKKDAEEKMQMTLEFLDETFARIRAGRANVRILDGVKVEYYGSLVPLSNVSTVTTPDAKTILIQVEKNMLKVIEKAIMDSGVVPAGYGEVIRSNSPLTEERPGSVKRPSRWRKMPRSVSVIPVVKGSMRCVSVKEGCPKIG